jgi:biopolymer transport protein ExbD
MRFKKRASSDAVPNLNIIPLMDAMLAILSFFILVSMSLVEDKAIYLQLPQSNLDWTEDIADPMVVELDKNLNISIGKDAVSQEEMLVQILQYLLKHPKGSVLLKPNEEIPFQTVMGFLTTMRQVGGDRISLLLQSEEEKT